MAGKPIGVYFFGIKNESLYLQSLMDIMNINWNERRVKNGISMCKYPTCEKTASVKVRRESQSVARIKESCPEHVNILRFARHSTTSEHCSMNCWCIPIYELDDRQFCWFHRPEKAQKMPKYCIHPSCSTLGKFLVEGTNIRHCHFHTAYAGIVIQNMRYEQAMQENFCKFAQEYAALVNMRYAQEIDAECGKLSDEIFDYLADDDVDMDETMNKCGLLLDYTEPADMDVTVRLMKKTLALDLLSHNTVLKSCENSSHVATMGVFEVDRAFIWRGFTMYLKIRTEEHMKLFIGDTTDPAVYAKMILESYPFVQSVCVVDIYARKLREAPSVDVIQFMREVISLARHLSDICVGNKQHVHFYHASGNNLTGYDFTAKMLGKRCAA